MSQETPDAVPTADYVEGHKVVCVLLAMLLPPLGAFLKVGLKGHFWLNILLTLFGYLPGVLHAIWVIIRDEKQKAETS